jgi:hypothetical protein
MTAETRPVWASQMEAAIRSLRGVEAARVQARGGALREIHVLTRPDRAPKQVVRDIQTLLLTRFDRPIDHRIVSVIQPRPGEVPAELPAVAGGEGPAPVARPEVAPRAAERIRFGAVNLFVAGPRAQAQVELRWKGIARMGSATGSATREGSDLLVAQATIAALQEFLGEDWALGVLGVEFVRIGKREVAVVALSLLAHRHEKALTGSCAVEQDVHQAVALATLAALNRVVGGIPTREPVEYVLRPASGQEESEAD